MKTITDQESQTKEYLLYVIRFTSKKEEAKKILDTRIQSTGVKRMIDIIKNR